MTLRFEYCQIAGTAIATASRAQLCSIMVTDCRERRRDCSPPLLLFDANGHGLSLRRTNAAYRRAMEEADVVHADGGFLVPASRWLTEKPIAERSATTDLIHDFAAGAAREGLSFYLLGGSEAANAECARRLQMLYSGLVIAGRRDGYFSKSEEALVIAEINALRPDIVWMGLGKPKEQILAAQWRGRLNAGWVVTCGGCFDFVAGRRRRAPRWMREHCLEWLFRMLTEPHRLFWRYFVTTPHALWLTLADRPRRRAQE